MTSETFGEGQVEEIELVIEPVPPDTVDSVKAMIEPFVRQSLKATGQGHLLDAGEITLDLEQTFPTDAAVTALFYLASGIAVKIFEVTLLPDIQREYQAWVRKRNRRQQDAVPEENYLAKLRQLLTAHFDEEELRTLCFDLGVDLDDLKGEGKAGKARELVTYLERRGRISELAAIGKRMRPHVDWEDPASGI